MQSTLIILKPDAIQRGLMGHLISRFEDKGLQIVGAKLMQIDQALAERHYALHKGKVFYEGLIHYMTAAPVMVLAIRGPSAIAVCRTMIGATCSLEAKPGTIRGDWGISKRFNLIHGSDGPQTADRELELFFSPNEILSYNQTLKTWTFDSS